MTGEGEKSGTSGNIGGGGKRVELVEIYGGGCKRVEPVEIYGGGAKE